VTDYLTGAHSGRLPTAPDRPSQILAQGALEGNTAIISAS
jgi:hypothetical protein